MNVLNFAKGKLDFHFEETESTYHEKFKNLQEMKYFMTSFVIG